MAPKTSGRIVLADSHVHLDRYPERSAKAMLARARRADVRRFLTIGVNVASSAAAVQLASRHRGVLAAIGVHPTRVDGLDLRRSMAQLEELADQPQVAAIGEVGLDVTTATSAQQPFLDGFLDMATDRNMPLVLHVVGAHELAQLMLSRHYPQRAVVHYFQDDAALAEAYLDLGCHISVGKPVTRPQCQALRTAVQRIPLNRLLLETDTYPLPGRTTEPRDVVDICRAVAELRGESFEAVARVTTENYRRLFSRGETRP